MANQKQLAVLKLGVKHWNKWRKKIDYFTKLDLSNTDLSGINLDGVNFNSVKLYGVNLDGATLRHAKLKYANLSSAKCEQTDFSGADFEEAKLPDANLRSATLKSVNFSDAKLERVNLIDANLRNANLNKAILVGAILRHAYLDSVNLNGADLRYADFSFADLSDANFHNVFLGHIRLTNRAADGEESKVSVGSKYIKDSELQEMYQEMYIAKPDGVIFSSANLSGADLSKLDLHNINFQQAIIRRADLSGANLSNANFYSAILSRTNLSNANLSNANLYNADLYQANLNNANLSSADLYGAMCEQADFSGANLKMARLTRTFLRNATLTDAHLWESQRGGWYIKGVVCESIYFEEEETPTHFIPGEFERLYSDKIKIVLFYKDGITPLEISTLPALIKKLEESYPRCNLRLESISDAAGGAAVTLAIDNAEDANLEAVTKVKAELEAKATELIKYQRKALTERRIRWQLEGEVKQLNSVVDKLIMKPSHAIQGDLIQGDKTMGDSYSVSGQAGAVGSNAHAHDMVFNQIGKQIEQSMDLAALANELEKLRQELKKEAATEEHDIIVSDIIKAKKAAEEKNSSKVAEYLKSSGKWALDVATRIGTSLAADAIKHSMG